MGKFTDQIKKMLRGGTHDQEFNQFKKKHGLSSQAKAVSIDQLGHDNYFIRSADNPKIFVHFEHGNYVARETPVMACVWKWKAGHEFIVQAKVDNPSYNLELIRIDEALKAYSENELRNPMADKLKKKK